MSAINQAKRGVALLKLDKPAPDHERVVHQALASRIARLLGLPYLPNPQSVPASRRYHLPNDTLADESLCTQLGIRATEDFFGGKVPFPFVATKALSHARFPSSPAPTGWSDGFCIEVGDALLDGYTVFDKAGAHEAGEALLATAPCRLKPVRATAGRGQHVITCLQQLEQVLAPMDEAQLATWGLVLEQQLEQVQTFSVGQITVAGTTLSYHGTQQLTTDHQNQEVYGGSTLVLARGGYDQLLAMPLDDHLRIAIDQACRFESAAFRHYPGLVASRRNYDIARGLDQDGHWRSGVLEQSWRVGGASSAEILALEAFIADPACQYLQASTHEVFGECQVPDDAVLFYQGDDREVGKICKYARVQPYGRPE